MKKPVLQFVALFILFVSAAIAWTWQAAALIGAAVFACYRLGPLLVRRLRDIPETVPVLGSLGRWMREDLVDALYLYDRSKRLEPLPSVTPGGSTWPPEPAKSPQPVPVEREPYIEPQDAPEFLALMQVLGSEHGGLDFETPPERDPYYRILLRLNRQTGLDFSIEVAFNFEYDDFEVTVYRQYKRHNWSETFSPSDPGEVVHGLISGSMRLLEEVISNGKAIRATLQVERENQWLPVDKWETWTWLRHRVSQRIVQNRP